jgi:hypothetical protein
MDFYINNELFNFKTDEEYLLELPEEIKIKSIKFLQEKLLPEWKDEIIAAYYQNPNEWIYSFYGGHLRWGMGCRNALRDNICLDDKLPSGNWDDYYIQLVEIAAGVREEK